MHLSASEVHDFPLATGFRPGSAGWRPFHLACFRPCTILLEYGTRRKQAKWKSRVLVYLAIWDKHRSCPILLWYTPSFAHTARPTPWLFNSHGCRLNSQPVNREVGPILWSAQDHSVGRADPHRSVPLGLLFS